MALILNIDTTTESGVVSISEKDKVLGFSINNDQKDHASFLQPTIKEVLQKADLSISELNAVAVTSGPGSYTGLRVGMASAKGLCYALKIPLILINTLEVMALSTIKYVKDRSALYCPMIDARRMEVFTAVYDYDLNEVIKPCPVIVDKESFKDLLQSNKIYFSGTGSLKLEKLLGNTNASFVTSEQIPDSMAQLSFAKYQQKSFADLFYSAPEYLKEFYTLNITG